MYRTLVIAFSTVDGVTQNPDGSPTQPRQVSVEATGPALHVRYEREVP
jgi:hypothetical protein